MASCCTHTTHVTPTSRLDALLYAYNGISFVLHPLIHRRRSQFLSTIHLAVRPSPLNRFTHLTCELRPTQPTIPLSYRPIKRRSLRMKERYYSCSCPSNSLCCLAHAKGNYINRSHERAHKTPAMACFAVRIRTYLIHGTDEKEATTLPSRSSPESSHGGSPTHSILYLTLQRAPTAQPCS